MKVCALIKADVLLERKPFESATDAVTSKASSVVSAVCAGIAGKCVRFIGCIEWVTFVIRSDVVSSPRLWALSSRLRHGMSLLSHFDLRYVRTKISGIAVPNWHTAAHTHTQLHTHFQMLQLVGWHRSESHTARTRRLPICRVLKSEVHYFRINAEWRKRGGRWARQY